MAASTPETDTSWHGAFTQVPSFLRFRHGQYGFSGFATADIPAGTTLLSLPYAKALNELYAAGTPVGKAAASLVATHPDRLSGRNILYLVMIAEAAETDNQSAAPFGPYLRSLPQRFDDPLWWGQSELQELAGTNLAAGVDFKRRWLRASWDALFPALYNSHPALFPSCVFTWERFLCAHSCFSSRGFPHALSIPPGHPSEGGPNNSTNSAVESVLTEGDDVSTAAGHSTGSPVGCMLPVLDILNHRYRTPIDWVRGPSAPAAGGDSTAVASETAVESSSSSCAAAPGHVSFVSRAPIPAGCEVFNNYGPKSNEELLLSFGFVLPRNPQDTLALRFGAAAGAPSAGDSASPPPASPSDPSLLLSWLMTRLRLPRRHVIRCEAGAREIASNSSSTSSGSEGNRDDLQPAIVSAGTSKNSSAKAASASSSSAAHSSASVSASGAAAVSSSSLPTLYDASITPPELLAVLRLASLGGEGMAAVAVALDGGGKGDAADVAASIRTRLLMPLGCGALIEEAALRSLQGQLIAKVQQLLQPPPLPPSLLSSGSSDSDGSPPPDRLWLARRLTQLAQSGGVERDLEAAEEEGNASVGAAGAGADAEAVQDGVGDTAAMAVPSHTEAGAAAGGSGEGHVRAYRTWMARTYVSGQLALLLQALGHVRQALAWMQSPPAASSESAGGAGARSMTISGCSSGSSGDGALATSSLQPLQLLLSPQLLQQHAGNIVCNLALSPLSSLTSADDVAAVRQTLGATIKLDGGGEGDASISASAAGRGQEEYVASVHAASSTDALLSLPTSLLLCPCNIPSINPALSEALDATEGLELHGRFAAASATASGDDADGEDEECDMQSQQPSSPSFDPELDALQLALLLMVERVKGAAGGETKSHFSGWLQWAEATFAEAAIHSFLGAEGQNARASGEAGAERRSAKRQRREEEDADAGEDEADEGGTDPEEEDAATALDCYQALSSQRWEQYQSLFSYLFSAFPALFKKKGPLKAFFSPSAFCWALTVVEACAVPMCVTGAPQLAIPPIAPRLPFRLVSPASETAAALLQASASQPAGSSASRVFSAASASSSAPVCARWSMQGDRAVLALLPSDASNGHSSAALKGRPVFLHAASPAAVQASSSTSRTGDPDSCSSSDVGDGAISEGARTVLPLLRARQRGDEEGDEDDEGDVASGDVEGDLAAYIGRFADCLPPVVVAATNVASSSSSSSSPGRGEAAAQLLVRTQ